MNIALLFACLPLFWRALLPMIPAAWLEGYSYWSPALLNTPNENGRTPMWRNVGYWEPGDTFSQADERLARKLLEFANVKPGGNVLDVAHGTGESLLIHLSTTPAPKRLDALTSLKSETTAAQDLVVNYGLEKGKLPEINWFTSSASYRKGYDLDHPLNPMRGFMGESAAAGAGAVQPDADAQVVFDTDSAADVKAKEATEAAAEGPEPYDLVYVLDAIYHIPPATPFFVNAVQPVLRPGSGVIAYTDVIPPPAIKSMAGFVVGAMIPPLLGIPARNVIQAPTTMDEYAEIIRSLGYNDVEVVDWSNHVWNGLASDFEKRGGYWAYVAKVVRYLERGQWKYVAVRAVAPLDAPEQKEV